MAGVAFLAALAILLLVKKRYAPVLWGLFAAIGAVMMWLSLPQPLPGDVFGAELNMSGKVEKVVAGPYNQRLIVSLDSRKGSWPRGTRALVSYHSMLPPVEAGDSVAFRARTSDPYRSAGVPDEYSPASYCRRFGVAVTGDVSDGAMTVTREATGFSRWLERRRRNVADALYYSGLSSAAAGFLTAVITGDDSAVDGSEREVFAHAGTAHLLALSGTHVAVTAFLVSLIMFPLAMMGRRRLQWILTISALWSFAIFTGCSPSVVRAVIMATVVLLARVFERNTNSFNSLCVAALAILVSEPLALLAPSFQMSFAAVAGILLFSQVIVPDRRLLPGVRPCLQWCGVSLGAVMGTAPISAWYFHQIPFYFMLANLPAALLFPLLMTGGLMILACNMAGLEAEWMCRIVDSGYRLLEGSAEWVSSLPGSYTDRVYFPAWLLIPVYGSILLLWAAIKMRRPVLWLCAAMTATFCVGSNFITKPVYPRFEAYGTEHFYSTVVIVREGTRAWIIDDAAERHSQSTRDKFSWRLRDFMSKRGIDSLEIARPGFRGRYFMAGDDVWRFGGKTVVLLKSDTVPPATADSGGRYLLITRGFKGDVGTLLDNGYMTSADTIIVSRALHSSRRNVIMEYLDSVGVIYRTDLKGALLR